MMSLAKFLLSAADKKHVVVDKALENIFQSAAGPSKSLQSLSASTLTLGSQAGGEKKRKRVMSARPQRNEQKRARKEKETNFRKGEETSRLPEAEQPKRSAGNKKAVLLYDNLYEEIQAEFSGQATVQIVTQSEQDSSESERSESDGEGDPSKLVHESLSKGLQNKARSSPSKRRHLPPGETHERRNARTIFVGNVPVQVVKSRPLQKRFRRHIISLVPTAKIESVRFRSVAFATPTSKLPTAEDDSGKVKGKSKAIDKSHEKDGRQHDRDRAASWRAKKDQEELEPEKRFLSPEEKKRIAFIKQELHDAVDAVNAYIVFAHPIFDTSTRPKNVPPPPPTKDPYEAAQLAAERCDGTVFMERTIRVDRVRRGTESTANEGTSTAVVIGDPKTTVFVGNLDFASKEEDLRAFFEALVTAERGPPGVGDGESGDGDESTSEDEEVGNSKVHVKKSLRWVKRVRIVRDKDTQLGKGFAYVQFADRECVDEILALEESSLRFAKRKLRVQRCKTVPGGAKVSPKFMKSPNAAIAKLPRVSAVRRSSSTASVPPKGNPALGEKISHLSRDERKKVKAADIDRVTRRMAKKKAKLLAEQGVKSRPGVERERVRKRPGEKKAVTKQSQHKKGRVKSGKALAKMNMKK